MSRFKAFSILVVAPILGLAFVVFLPAAGFYLVGRELWLKSRLQLGRVVVSLQHFV